MLTVRETVQGLAKNSLYYLAQFFFKSRTILKLKVYEQKEINKWRGESNLNRVV